MKTQRERYSRQQSAETPPAPKKGLTAGMPLPDRTSTQMGAAFGHDFSQVRVFADEAAAETAQDLGAKAYTVGSDIFFNDNFYDPHGSDGRKLLAHELTHVVQQDRHGIGAALSRRGVSDPTDASEREAEAVSEQVAAGGSVQVQAAPSAVASRGLLDWVEDKASSAAGAVSDAASGAWDGAKSVASDAVGAVGSAASTAWDGTKAAAGAVGNFVADEAKQEYAGMKMLGGYVKQGEEAVGHGIDWVEDKEKAGTSWVADKAKGIPVLEQVANAGKSLVDTQTELTGGVARGVTGLVGGVAGMVANPVDTAKGLEAMAEHIPIIPGVPNPLKAAHGLLNVATGDETMGQFGDSLNPMNSMKDDGQFWKTVGGGLVGQYSEQWKEGKYADVVGHAGFDIGSLFLGAGEANAAGKLGEAAKLADAAKLGQAADLAKLGDAAKLGEAADASKLADAAKAGDAADLAKVDDAASVTKADEAVDLGKAETGGGGHAGEPPTSEPPSGGGGGGPEPLDNPAHNRADFERLKQQYAQEEIMGAEPKGSALKGGSGDVRSTQVMENKEIIVDGKPKMVQKRVEGVRDVKMDVDVDHSAPIFEQPRIAEDGRVFPLDGNKNLTQMPSGVNGRDGIVEYITDGKGDLVHQQFIEGGGVNGVPGGRPRVRPTNGSYYLEEEAATKRPYADPVAPTPVETPAAPTVETPVTAEPPAPSPISGEPLAGPEPLDNPAHNAADYQRLKESLAEQQRTFGPERGPTPPGGTGNMSGGGGDRYHSIYDDGTLVREGEQPPRLGAARPDPEAAGAHTRLRWDETSPSRGGEGQGRVYQGREFDDAGNPVRDIDFTSPTYPNGNVRPDHAPAPHEHPYIPNDPNNPRAGYRRSTDARPFTWEED